MIRLIRNHKWFLILIAIFTYLQSIQVRILVRQKVNIYTFTPDGGIATFISLCILFFILYKLINKSTFTQNIYELLLKALGAIVIYLIVTNLTSFLISLSFNNIDRNFNVTTLLRSNTSNLLNGFIYTGFYLVYHFYLKNKRNQADIMTYNSALADSKISQLKAQLNPHFLFNNLNILDQLIYEDRDKASDFLAEFSEIYRYILKTSDKKLVTLEEELSFAHTYFELIQFRFEGSYELNVIEKYDAKAKMLPPLTLQLLLENVIEHNSGSKDNPNVITVEVGENLTVSNQLRPKMSKKKDGGRALKNLKSQYELLTDKKIKIENESGFFSISLPLLSLQLDD